MPKDGASRAQQKKVSKRASLTVPRGRTDSGNAHNRRETHRPGTSDEESDEIPQGELKEHIISILNLRATAKFVLGRKPEIISQVESFTRQYPELPLFIQNGSHAKFLAQDSLPLFTEWDEDESARFAQESQPAPIGGDGRYSPTSLPPTVNEAGQSTKTDLAPADTTTQPKNNLIPATLDRVSSGQLTHEAIVKDARSDALPETLANGATQPGSPSVWMSYAQNPSYAGPWPSMADQNSVGAANAMPQENKTPILSAPFSIPSGSTADFGSFPPGAVPPGPGQFFQHLHGLGAPQYDPRFYPYAAYPPFISRAGPNLQQGNVSVGRWI
ncbi:hypothetical protein BJX66DRAFT_116428 [Aspergillus keveii]|uniref:Uncharacterized protein n=1 Tax=Aspergillus keveii TaxID=714993 RepID=A0ABR4FKD9_9EURO